ncbi:hypothetical protein D3C71_2205570 [compost metagenome]
MIFEKALVRRHPEHRIGVGVGDFDLQGSGLAGPRLSGSRRIPLGAAAGKNSHKGKG